MKLTVMFARIEFEDIVLPVSGALIYHLTMLITFINTAGILILIKCTGNIFLLCKVVVSHTAAF